MATELLTSAWEPENFFETTLSADCTDSDTDIFLTGVPTNIEGTLIIDPESATSREIIYYSSKTATKVTCPANGRGYDNTTAVPHLSGTKVIMAPIADWFNSVKAGKVFDAGAIGTEDLADASVTNAKLATGAGEPGGAWTSWTPTLTNLSGGTLNYAKYTQIGKTVHFRLKYTLGGAGMGSQPIFSVPVNLHADYSNNAESIQATVTLLDNGTNVHIGYLRWNSASTLQITAENASGTYTATAPISSTVPFTWASGDIVQISGTYEAA